MVLKEVIFHCCVTKGPWALEESGRSQQGQPRTWDMHVSGGTEEEGCVRGSRGGGEQERHHTLATESIGSKIFKRKER